ncbi:fanconi-associated nuclease 1 homolog isoform X1 [Tanacetum coccineum]|uniref:Fanconi-associated nuclease n=1 Tax=Tanacetum coccineum TaxID=301880 RepID=A0ABQ4X923_9ASTR
MDTRWLRWSDCIPYVPSRLNYVVIRTRISEPVFRRAIETSSDRSDVFTRVQKLDQLIKDVKELCSFGRVQTEVNPRPETIDVKLFFCNGEQDLSAFLLVDLGIVKYPTYNCVVTDQIFSSRNDLITYEEALEVAQIMDEYLEENDSSMVLRCLLLIYEEYLAKIDGDFLHLLADVAAIAVSPSTRSCVSRVDNEKDSCWTSGRFWI